MMPQNKVWYAGERLILRVILIALCLIFWVVLVPKIWELFSPFLIALLVAAFLQPLIRFGKEKLKLRRGVVTAFCVLAAVAAAFLLLYWFASFAVVQLVSAAENAQSIINSVVGVLQTAADRVLAMASSLPQNVGDTIRTSLNSAFGSLSSAGMRFATGLVNWVVSFAAALPYAFIYANFLILATIFITNRYESLSGYLKKIFHPEDEKNIKVLRQSAGKGMIGYIRVQLLFSLLTFLLSWVFFQSTGFDYAFLIGFIAALLELIPQFGCGTLYLPWSAICFIVGTHRNGWLVLGLYLGYSLLRRVTEPALLGSNLGVSPLASLVGMFVGMKLAGVIGLIFGPIVMVILVNAVRSHLFDSLLSDINTLAAYMRERWQRGKPAV